MRKPETLEEFYQKKFNWLPDNLQRSIGHFNVFRLEDCVGPAAVPIEYTRREFYKISLVRGKSIYHYADKSIQVTGCTLLFFNPQVPYTWELLSDDLSGFFCIFKEAFFTGVSRIPLQELPMFRPGGLPFYVLNEQQQAEVCQLFDKLFTEINSDYQHKYELIRSYVTELIHYGLKLQPSQTLHQHPNAKLRLTTVFTELLERQFPIESPAQRFTMRSASDFARQLSVHVNYLNRSVRETTGRTTTDHIAERLVSEAKALLKHTDWNVSEIAYCLGFDEPAHFNYFFKRHTQLTPTAFRKD